MFSSIRIIQNWRDYFYQTHTLISKLYNELLNFLRRKSHFLEILQTHILSYAILKDLFVLFRTIVDISFILTGVYLAPFLYRTRHSDMRIDIGIWNISSFYEFRHSKRTFKVTSAKQNNNIWTRHQIFCHFKKKLFLNCNSKNIHNVSNFYVFALFRISIIDQGKK